MNVLSLFDGCGCAKVALDRRGIPCTYFASEIDKYAIKIAQKNHPDMIQLGDVRTVNPFLLPEIDLLVGGSPCQDLSIAGRMAGLKGERSGLFFDYVRLLHYLKPQYFLLENVASMSKINRWIMSQFLGVEPVMIDSARVSAQSRKRFYWTNIPGVGQPLDKGILLRDILESGVVDRDKSYCIDANYFKFTNLKQYQTKSRRQVDYLPDKPNKDTGPEFVRYIDAEGAVFEGYDCVRQGVIKERFRVWGVDGKSPSLNTFYRHNVAVQLGYINKNQQGRRVYSTDAKSVSLKSEGGGWGAKMGLYLDDSQIRKLTPIECERLQTLPDDYTEGVSNTQRYKMLGNAFTVDVIAHILSYMR